MNNANHAASQMKLRPADVFFRVIMSRLNQAVLVSGPLGANEATLRRLF